jgi:hypothetical protein
MAYDVTKLLGDPNPGITLDELATELNELAKLRDASRVAFCKRLAVAYLMVVGHVPIGGSRDGLKFYKWCDQKIRSANGKRYTIGVLKNYIRVGFASNPQKKYEQLLESSKLYNQRQRADVRTAIRYAVTTDTPPKVIPITKLKAQGLPTDVAREVNALMTAWEQASSQARSQFIYIVTGKRIAA